MKTAEDFLLAGHHSGKGAQGIPSWVTGLAFCSLILVPLRSWVWPPMLLNTALWQRTFIGWEQSQPWCFWLSLWCPFTIRAKSALYLSILRKRFNEPTRAFNAFRLPSWQCLCLVWISMRLRLSFRWFWVGLCMLQSGLPPLLCLPTPWLVAWLHLSITK